MKDMAMKRKLVLLCAALRLAAFRADERSAAVAKLRAQGQRPREPRIRARLRKRRPSRHAGHAHPHDRQFARRDRVRRRLPRDARGEPALRGEDDKKPCALLLVAPIVAPAAVASATGSLFRCCSAARRSAASSTSATASRSVRADLTCGTDFGNEQEWGRGPGVLWIAAAMLVFALARARGGNRPLALLVLEIAGSLLIATLAWSRQLEPSWGALPATIRWALALLVLVPLVQQFPPMPRVVVVRDAAGTRRLRGRAPGSGRPPATRRALTIQRRTPPSTRPSRSFPA